MQERSVNNSETTEPPLKKARNDLGPSKFNKGDKNSLKAFKKLPKNSLNSMKLDQKPEDWNTFKKEKKELKLKRKKSKGGYDIIVTAKQIGEKLRCKTLKGGEIERNQLINQLHTLLKGQNCYGKFVLAHDTSRIVQWLLKYASNIVKEQIAQELTPKTLEMIQSPYGIHAIKRLLKYGNQQIKSQIINNFYGHAVKLTSHALSAPIVELAYSQWANPTQKMHLIQEFYGDMYKDSKDDNVKNLKDVFEKSPTLKNASLAAIKTNLMRILNKKLLDSTLVQSVLFQFLEECNTEDRSELITQLAPHIVVISNSKDGCKVAMKIIWFGTNKDRKIAMKTLKEHILELAKHEYGHKTIITLIDATDDTVLLHKIILQELLKNARDLSQNEWSRKILIWMIAPGNKNYFHPVFIKELENGRKQSTCKKSQEIRRQEIFDYSIDTLLELIVEEPQFWLENPTIAFEMFPILKAAKGDNAKKAFESIVKIITQQDWQVKSGEKLIFGVEDTGFHLIFKKLISNCHLFVDCLVEHLNNDLLKLWLTSNRGCFLLLVAYEKGSEMVQKKLKEMLGHHLKLLKGQNTAGAEILLKKTI